MVRYLSGQSPVCRGLDVIINGPSSLPVYFVESGIRDRDQTYRTNGSVTSGTYRFHVSADEDVMRFCEGDRLIALR